MEQKLFNLQDKYYKEKKSIKKQQIWSEMFELVQKYSKSLILKKIKNTIGKYFDPSDVDDAGTQTALAFMSQYLNRPGFHIGASFAGMINFKVTETLYKESNEDLCSSLHSIVGNTDLELEDMQQTSGFKTLYDTEFEPPDMFISNISINKLVNDVIYDFNKAVDDESIRFKNLAYLLILLRKSKNKHIKPSFLKYIITTKKEYDLLNLFELEFQTRLAEI